MAWPDSPARTKHHIFGGGRLISILRYYCLTVLFQGICSNKLFSPSVSWGDAGERPRHLLSLRKETYGLPLAMTGRMTIGSTLYFCAPGETGELGDNLARGETSLHLTTS
jgi:hypothetical protein